MTVRAKAVLLAAALLLSAGCEQQSGEALQPESQTAAPAGKAPPIGNGFDFYVLSLSWSPSYCEAEGEDANRQQCTAARPYAFVVHGLWPQFERGYPENCTTGEPDVSREMLRALYDLMPSAGLIRHEWRTHGTCTGLSQNDYFAVLRAAREKIEIPRDFLRLDDYRTLGPDDMESAFLKANQRLQANGVAVTCDERYLRDVRVCMTKDLAFRSCPEVDRRACRLPKVVMPPVRGR